MALTEAEIQDLMSRSGTLTLEEEKELLQALEAAMMYEIDRMREKLGMGPREENNQ